MDSIDKQILNQVQGCFPLSSRPFAELADRMGLTEDDVLERIRRLKNEGYIRRIGGVFDAPKLGFYSTLAAVQVEPGRLEAVARYINQFEGVTHNYQRNHTFNLWFTVTAPSEKEADDVLSEVKAQNGVKDVLKLPAERVYKIGLNLVLK